MSPTATRQSPVRPASPQLVAAGRNEFPVRFTSSIGATSLLRRPPNPFYWVGQGALLLDERGVHVTAKRLSLLGPRRVTRFFTPREISEVYREGNALRIDLQVDGRHSSLRLWAEDAESAAEIVQRLPTSRTIELEVTLWSGASKAPERYRLPPVAIGLSVLGIAALLVWMFAIHSSSRPQVAAPPLSSENLPHAPPVVIDFATRAALAKFVPRFDALATEFATAFEALQQGNLSQQQFDYGLNQWLIPQWQDLAAQVPSEEMPYAESQLRGAANSWYLALSTYSRGLRSHDSNEVLRSFDYLRDAEAYQRNARDLLETNSDK